MNTKDNQRTRLSKKLFREALLELLNDDRPIEKISVRELCEKAELNRSTFYAHYTQPREILREAEDELLEATKRHLREIGQGSAGDAKAYLSSFLRFIKENAGPFGTLFLTSADPDFRGRFTQLAMLQLLSSFRVELPRDEEQFVYSFLMQGSLGVILQWMRAEYAAPVGRIVDLLLLLNDSALKGLAR